MTLTFPLTEDNKPLPSTPAAAKAAGVTHYFTGKPCPRGHVAPRYASTAACTACAFEKVMEAAARDPEKKNAIARRCYHKHRDKNIERMRRYSAEKPQWFVESVARYRAANLSTLYAKTAAWRAANPGKVSASFKAWAEANPTKLREKSMRRHASKLRATPAWLTDTHVAEMEAFYAEAARLTAETGIPHEVDHIIPLRSNRACGLHVPCNLQVLTSKANRSKGNRLPLD